MKKFLLAALLALVGVFYASAEFQEGTPLGSSTTVDGVDYNIYVLDQEAKKAAVSFNTTGNVTVPTQIDQVEKGGTTYDVIQINSANAKSITVPATILTIGPNAFSNATALESIIFEKGDTPLELYQSFGIDGIYSLSYVEILRDIKGITVDSNNHAIFFPYPNISMSLKIGADVTLIDGPLFETTFFQR